MNYLILGTLVLGSFVWYTYSGKNLISSAKAKELISRNEIKMIIDVRTASEFSLGHYPNSLNIPVQSFSHDTFKNFNKDIPYLVYCNTGQRARRATELLNQYGFKKVYYIAGHYSSLL